MSSRMIKRLFCTRDHRLVIDLRWETRDLWWGVFWTAEGGFAIVYVCLVPLLPLRFAWRMSRTDDAAEGTGAPERP